MRSGTRKNERLRKLKLKDKILDNIYHNLKEYIIVTIILIIGIIAGVLFVNYMNDTQTNEVKEYIEGFINSLKGDYSIDRGKLLKNSLIENLKLAISMWFIGSTVIGIPIVFEIVLYRGFCLGYTVSSAIAVLGMQKGTVFFLTTILLQNIIIIPVLISLAVSGMKLYKSIMKDKRKENIKLEIIRHTMVSIMLFILLAIASLVEVYISTNLLTMCINFFWKKIKKFKKCIYFFDIIWYNI